MASGLVLLCTVIGPIPWGHSCPLRHALSLLSMLLWTSMRRRRAMSTTTTTTTTARDRGDRYGPMEWAR